MTTEATKEKELYQPPPGVLEAAYIKDRDAVTREAERDLTAFWEDRAREFEWFKPWDQVLDDSNAPFYQWFVGGKVNIVYNCLDRHVQSWKRNKLALIWESEQGEVRTFSYHALNREVCMFANVLRSMGVRKGDRVTIYMGRVPELPIAMLACAKIGAVHSVVYGGFSVEALHGRIEDSQSRVVITCDGGYMNGKIVELKQIVDEALKRSPTVEHVIVYRRTGHTVNMESGRDYWWHDLMGLPVARSMNGGSRCETEVMDAEDPLFMLYTSGTTGRPKAILHTHGGYMVGIATTLKWVFDVKEEDRYWCTADPGWITGHSYVVYGPLLLGATSFIYEGAPTFPYPNRWWSMIEKYGVTIFYTAPTAIRGLMRFGEAWPNRHDLSSLRLLGSVGEPINPEAWRWYYDVIGKNRCPIMDTWWQTETGAFMITPTPVVPLKPGSGTRPFFGQVAEIVDEEGKPVPDGAEGYLVLTRPWPSMLRTIYKDPDRYAFQTQIFFLLTRYKQQRELGQADLFHRFLVTDYIFEKDKIFAYLNLQDEELKLYETLVSSIQHNIVNPDLVVYLQSSVPRLMENIRRRGRDFEANMQESYIRDLNEAYNYFFFRYRTTPLLIVNSTELDFVSNREHFEDLVRAIFRPTHSAVEYYNPVVQKDK